MEPDFAEMTKRLQAQANDCGSDHCYVGMSKMGIDGMIASAVLEGDDAARSARIGHLECASIQAIRAWRANGGIGSAFVKASAGDSPDLIEHHIKICKHPNEALALAREGYLV